MLNTSYLKKINTGITNKSRIFIVFGLIAIGGYCKMSYALKDTSKVGPVGFEPTTKRL